MKMCDARSHSSNTVSVRDYGSCPQCKKLSTKEFYPFCSRYCKNTDLNSWLSGRYIIPGEQKDEISD